MTLGGWLKARAKEPINKCAHITGDSYKRASCVQDANESLQAFTQLFSSYWDEIMDFDMGEDERLAVSTFMSNVNPQIAILCQVAG